MITDIITNDDKIYHKLYNSSKVPQSYLENLIEFFYTQFNFKFNIYTLETLYNSQDFQNYYDKFISTLCKSHQVYY